MEEQKPYTIEQYQRCLKMATEMSDAILNMKLYPLSPDMLKELYEAQRKYEKVTTEVVNESCEL